MHHGTASAISGASAGLAASIVTCPLDVVKTRLQAQVGPLPPSLRPPPPPPPPGGVTAAGAAAGAGVSQLAKEAVDKAARAVVGASPAGQGVGAAEAARGARHAAIPGLEAQYQSIPQIMRRIWIEDGFKGFYRGLGPTIFGYLPTWAIYFSVYDTCKDTLASTLHLNSGHTEFVNHIVAAMAAGAASTVCTSPLWVVKTRFMLQTATDPNVKRYRHTGDAFVQIWRAEGWRGFYKGLLPSLFGVSHVAVQFPLYEQFKSWARASRRRKLERERGIAPGSEAGPSALREAILGNGNATSRGTPGGGGGGGAVTAEEEAALPSSTILVCSSTAKMIASVATYPHEVLRTKLQMQPKTSAAKGAAAAAAAVGAGAGGGRGVASVRLGEGASRSFHTMLARSGGSMSSTAAVPSTRGATSSLSWHALPPSASVRRRMRKAAQGEGRAGLSHSAPLRDGRTPASPSPSQPRHHHLEGRGPSHALSGLTDHHHHHHHHDHAEASRSHPPSSASTSMGGRYTGVVQACKTIAREEGLRGFYRGMTVNLVRTVPNSALTILTYELMMRQLTGSSP